VKQMRKDVKKELANEDASERATMTKPKNRKIPTKSHGIAVDENVAIRGSVACYTISKLEQRFGFKFSEKMQTNDRISKWVRMKEKELAKKYGSSTCEFHEMLVLSVVLADEGIKEFLILSPSVNFYAQPVLVRRVEKRRRKMVQDVEEEVVEPVVAEPRCDFCQKPLVARFRSVKIGKIMAACDFHTKQLRKRPDWVEVQKAE